MSLDQGVIVAILTHATATIWWASKVHTTLSFISKDLTRISAEIGSRDQAFQTQIQGMWKRVDALHEEIFQLSQRVPKA